MTLREVPDGHVFFFLCPEDPDNNPPLYMKLGGMIVKIPEDKHTVTVTGKETHAIPLTAPLLGLEVMDMSLVLAALFITSLTAG